jgi:hypothetical protein
MPHPQRRLRLVRSHSSPQIPQTSGTSSRSSTNLAPEPLPSPTIYALEQEPLGNKLQRLAAISPRHIRHVERLVDHLLESLGDNKNRMSILLLCWFIGF